MKRRQQPDWRLLVRSALLLVLAAPSLSAVPAAAQEPVDLGALVKETFQPSSDPNRMSVVWWIPEDFWRVALQAQGSMTESGIAEMLAVVRPYLLLAAVDGAIGPFGGPTFVAEETLRDSLRVRDGSGVEYKPLPDNELSPDLRNLFSAFKPAMANLVGPLGENLRFYAFPAKNGDGNLIADATQPGGFSVRLGSQELRWRLPLGSLVPQKTCPVDGERLNGAWQYCPWHGKELLPQAPPTSPAGEEQHPAPPLDPPPGRWR